MRFQSTLPMRGATGGKAKQTASKTISIHAPHEGSDVPRSCCVTVGVKFQSTLPMRGATASIALSNRAQTISIHAPHEGSDQHGDVSGVWGADFNPRSP